MGVSNSRAFKISLVVVFLSTFVHISFAAVGCTLNDPDRDIKRLFPNSTGYRTSFITIEERGGEELKKRIEDKLGDKFDPIYENIDVPYAYYDVLQGEEVIARIHGVNQKGKYGGIQLILATDLDGKIIEFYYQRISSPEAKKFRGSLFTDQFISLTLEDLCKDSIDINDPSKDNYEDFFFTLRGIKKNLILLHEFKLGNNK